MECTRPTAEELRESARQREAADREVALRIPAIAKPGMTFGQLAELLGCRLEVLARVIVARCIQTETDVRLKDPLGRKVSRAGVPCDEFGDYPSTRTGVSNG